MFKSEQINFGYYVLLRILPVMVQTFECSSCLLLTQLGHLRYVEANFRSPWYKLANNDRVVTVYVDLGAKTADNISVAEILGHLDELVNADRVVAVSVHQGEGLVALLNSVHLLPVFVSLFSSVCVSSRGHFLNSPIWSTSLRWILKLIDL